MVEKLARDIEDADERARSMIEGQRAAGPLAPAVDIGRVTEAIRDLDRRIARMGERPAPRRDEPAAGLDEIGSRLNALLAERPQARAAAGGERAATLDAALRGLETRIDEAKARIIQPRAAASGEAEQIARIERRLSDIGSRLAGRDRAAQPQSTRGTGAQTGRGRRPRRGDCRDLGASAPARRALRGARPCAAGTRRAATMETLRSDLAALSNQVADP